MSQPNQYQHVHVYGRRWTRWAQAVVAITVIAVITQAAPLATQVAVPLVEVAAVYSLANCRYLISQDYKDALSCYHNYNSYTWRMCYRKCVLLASSLSSYPRIAPYALITKSFLLITEGEILDGNPETANKLINKRTSKQTNQQTNKLLSRDWSWGWVEALEI